MHRSRHAPSAAGAEPANKHLWHAYRRSRSPALRNLLIEDYLELVRDIAGRVASKVRGVVRAEELLTPGTFGLINAIDAFDESRAVKFTTFSAIHIRGAMLDELRAIDMAPRRVRSRARKLESTAQLLLAELGRPPADHELAARLNLDDEGYRNWSCDARLAGVRALPGACDAKDRDERLAGVSLPADPNSLDPAREAQKRALHEIFTSGFSRAERLLVTLYYYEDLSMREIGRVLDLSESRVSQMHSSIRNRLRDRVRFDRPQTADELAA